MGYNRSPVCPIVQHAIEDIDCIEASDAVAGLAPETVVSAEIRAIPNWQEICRGCEYFNKE